MKNKKILPIGTVVKLEEADKTIMIIGFYPISNKNNEKMYDYAGCLYPEGLMSSEDTIMFNAKSIKEVIFKGYENEDELKFKEEVNKLMNNNIEVVDL